MVDVNKSFLSMNWDSGVVKGISLLSFIALRSKCISIDMNKGGTAYYTSFDKDVFLFGGELI